MSDERSTDDQQEYPPLLPFLREGGLDAGEESFADELMPGDAEHGWIAAPAEFELEEDTGGLPRKRGEGEGALVEFWTDEEESTRSSGQEANWNADRFIEGEPDAYDDEGSPSVDEIHPVGLH